MKTLQDLQDALAAATLPERDRELAAAIAADLAGLAAAAATGQDITGELAHVQAQVANLSAGSAARISVAFQQWMADLATGLIRATL